MLLVPLQAGKSGLNKMFEFDVNGSSLLARFHRSLLDGSTSDKSAKNKTAHVNKLLHWLHKQSSEEMPPVSDIHVVTNLDQVATYFKLLRSNLDGSGRGIGLQTTSIKNELSALKQFAEWAAIDNYQDRELHSQLHYLVNFVKDHCSWLDVKFLNVWFAEFHRYCLGM